MRVAIVYPPIKRDGKIPLLGQNRQFKFTNSNEIKIFPLIPASLATILKNNGYEVLWLDAINKHIPDFESQISNFKPDIAVIETKAPIIEDHWEFISNLKSEIANLKCILVGDHVSFFPKESLLNSEVDYVVTGGDYDITVSKLPSANGIFKTSPITSTFSPATTSKAVYDSAFFRIKDLYFAEPAPTSTTLPWAYSSKLIRTSRVRVKCFFWSDI